MKMIIAIATLSFALTAAASAFAADSPRGEMYIAQAGTSVSKVHVASFVGRGKVHSASFVGRGKVKAHAFVAKPVATVYSPMSFDPDGPFHGSQR